MTSTINKRDQKKITPPPQLPQDNISEKPNKRKSTTTTSLPLPLTEKFLEMNAKFYSKG